MKQIITYLSAILISYNSFAQNVGIGTSNPQSRFSIGTSSEFQVDSLGNIKKINNVSYSFPSSQGSIGQVLTNNGSGNLTWANSNAGSTAAVPSGAIVLSFNFDSSIINAGYTFIGTQQATSQSDFNGTFGWQWNNNQTSQINAPSPRSGHCAVWTGTEMIIWGGYGFNSNYNNGARYNPKTNTWTSISTIGAPSARYGSSAVWTGTDMIIWGGAYNGTSNLNDGYKYNLASNSWSTISTINAPSARRGATAVWTGTEMIIWGGENSSVIQTGGRFNPSTGLWNTIAMPTTFAPTARSGHSAVWTGSVMLIWGGYTTVNTNNGGQYDPVTNSWGGALSINSAPSARRGASAVWNGSNMIIYGGYNGSNAMNDTYLYNYGTDTWTTALAGPFSLNDQSSVWTGSEMIVWGGVNGSNLYNVGYKWGNYPNTNTAYTQTMYLYRKN